MNYVANAARTIGDTASKYGSVVKMESEAWTVRAFQKQRSATWKAIRLWLFFLALGAIGFCTPLWMNKEKVDTSRSSLGRVRISLSSSDETEGQFTLGLISLIVIFTAGIAIILGVRRHYRCPRCNEIPMGSWTDLGPSKFSMSSGVEVYPTLCPNCGAKLS